MNVEFWTITLSTWEIAERATGGQHISDDDLVEKNPFKLPLLRGYMNFCYKDVDRILFGVVKNPVTVLAAVYCGPIIGWTYPRVSITATLVLYVLP